MSTTEPSAKITVVGPAAGSEEQLVVPSRFARPGLASGGRSLVFELIPQVMHRKCVRAVLPNDVWRLLRKLTIDVHGKRCAECGNSQALECHEVWNYFVLPPITGKGNRPVMKLVDLKSLCHLCHLGKHIGYAHSDSKAYERVKQHLMELYRLPESIFSQLEQLAFEEVHELNKAGVRELDLKFLNDVMMRRPSSDRSCIWNPQELKKYSRLDPLHANAIGNFLSKRRLMSATKALPTP
jgi:hypothetical protein